MYNFFDVRFLLKSFTSFEYDSLKGSQNQTGCVRNVWKNRCVENGKMMKTRKLKKKMCSLFFFFLEI